MPLSMLAVGGEEAGLFRVWACDAGKPQMAKVIVMTVIMSMMAD